MAFSDQQIQDLRERADLVSLIGKRVALKKRGRDHVGLCPFHGERSPSFNVIPHKGMYHCFGCGESGDVFKFFMKLDGLGFVDALKLVAAESGIILLEENADPEADKRRKHHDDLAALLERAAKFYEAKLWHAHGKPAMDHLRDRGISEQWIKRFRLGFGGHGREDLTLALEKAGIDFAMAEEAGLCIPSKRGGRPFDRFSGRLLVPIAVPRPPNGRVVAFGGRWLDGVLPPPPDRKPAKYINSPETPLYSKGTILFGLDVARDAIRKEEKAVIVEGYFDVIGVHQAGLPLAVATCGTSLTPQHLELLTRTGAKEILFLFDGDAAGLRAAERAAELCAKGSVPARVATLPNNQDPDDYAKEHGIDALRGLLEKARPAVELLIDVALSDVGDGASVEERVRAVQAVRGVILSAPEGLARSMYVQQVAERLRVREQDVRDVIEQPVPVPRSPRKVQAGPDSEPYAPPAASTRGPDASRPQGNSQRFERRPPPPRKSPEEIVRDLSAEAQLPVEIAITARLLSFPVLSSAVAQSGSLGEFLNKELRELCEQVIQAFGDHEAIEPLFLVRSAVTSPGLQAKLVRELRLDAQESELDASARVTEANEYLALMFDELVERRLKREAQTTKLELPKAPPADLDAERRLQEELNRRLDAKRALDRKRNARPAPATPTPAAPAEVPSEQQQVGVRGDEGAEEPGDE